MKKQSNKLNIIILVIFSFLVLYFTLKDDFNSVIGNILTINFGWLLVAVLLMYGYWHFRAKAYHSIIKNFDKDYTFKRSLSLMLLTQFFNAITPFASGGQPLVVLTLKKDGIRGSDGTNIVMQDFITYQIALIFLATLAVLYNNIFHLFPKTALLKEIVTLGYLINVAVVVSLFILAFARKFNHWVAKFGIKILNRFNFIKDKEKTVNKWENRINRFHDGAKLLFKDKKLFIRLIGYNLIAMLSIYLIPLALIFGMGNYNAFSGIESIVASAYIFLVGSFVPIPGSTGALEFTFIAFFANFVTGSVLNSVMLVWRLLTYYLGLTVGALVLNFWRSR